MSNSRLVLTVAEKLWLLARRPPFSQSTWPVMSSSRPLREPKMVQKPQMRQKASVKRCACGWLDVDRANAVSLLMNVWHLPRTRSLSCWMTSRSRR